MSESPFLPGTHIQYAWDSTSLGWLKTCPRLYQYHMIEGWRSKSESVHLKFGQWYHSALELYDRCRAESTGHEEALIVVIRSCMTLTWDFEDCPECNGSGFVQSGVCGNCVGGHTGPGHPWSSDHPLKTRENLIRSIIWYLDHFSNDAAQTIQLANGKPAVELSFRMELNYGPAASAQTRYDTAQGELIQGKPYILCGHLDRLVSLAGGTYVMDRKTTSMALGSNYFDQYSPDNQMSLYSLAAKVIYQTPVKGVIIDAAELKVGFTRFGRGMTFRTDAELEEWLDETKHWLRLAEGFASEGYWPRNDKACHHYGGCTFRKVCSKSPEVRQKFLESDFTKHPWNPLEAR